MGMNSMLIQTAKRKRFNIIQGKASIEKMIDKLPTQDECFKFFSKGGFSSICFILFIAQRTKINQLNVSTFAIGKKEMKSLNLLHKQGRIDKADFMIGTIAKKEGSELLNVVTNVCKENGWNLRFLRNHSKVLLFDTDAGKFVIETSSNLNENPQIEQFSFEKDTELYNFYKTNLFDNN